VNVIGRPRFNSSLVCPQRSKKPGSAGEGASQLPSSSDRIADPVLGADRAIQQLALSKRIGRAKSAPGRDRHWWTLMNLSGQEGWRSQETSGWRHEFRLWQGRHPHWTWWRAHRLAKVGPSAPPCWPPASLSRHTARKEAAFIAGVLEGRTCCGSVVDLKDQLQGGGAAGLPEQIKAPFLPGPPAVKVWLVCKASRAGVVIDQASSPAQVASHRAAAASARPTGDRGMRCR